MAASIFVLVVLLLFCYAAYVEPYRLKVERVTVGLKRLPPQFSGLTIALMSDQHLGKYDNSRKFRMAVDAVLGLEPDMVVFGGDFVTWMSRETAVTMEKELSLITAPMGKFAIFGNHDVWFHNEEPISEILRRTDTTLLRNSHVELHREGGTLYLAGIDDVMEGRQDLPSAMRGIPADAPVVLLAHEPDFADSASKDGRIILQLSGHSHGGQVRIPGLPAFIVPDWGRKYTDGLYSIGSLFLYVTRGVGVVPPPIRLFCRPELTLLTLEKL
jgi:predicted MPP superfamily phosphohydrolase